MKITPDPVLTTVEFSEEDDLYRVSVRDEEVINFGMSEDWFISKLSVTRDRRAMVLTVEKRSEEDETDRP